MYCKSAIVSFWKSALPFWELRTNLTETYKTVYFPSGIPRNFVRGGVQQTQLRTEDRENRDLGAVAPYSRVLEAAVIWYKKFHFI